MHIDLSDDETAVLLRELDHIIEGDRFPLSPRVLTLKAIARSSGRNPIASLYRRRSTTSRRAWVGGKGGRAAVARGWALTSRDASFAIARHS
jgi:hypothetical protein